ncbi:MAG: trigger factor [Alphaproteobacteria bacterium]|nr:trigger factor [Alphaproteobacteria bacterium]
MIGEQEMEITENKSKGLKKSFTVVASADEIAFKTKKKMEEIAKTAKADGFRPGKVPLAMLEQRYGKTAQNEVIDGIIEAACDEIVEETKITLAGRPAVKIEEYKVGENLKMAIEVEAMPTIYVDGFDFKRIKIERPRADVEDAMIDQALERIAARHKKPQDTDRGYKAKTGDVAVIDFVGSVDGVEFDGGKADDFGLELGSNQFISGFEEQVVGASAGDKIDVKVDFPKEYHAQNLAGKPAVFAVTVKAIKTLKTPAIDDEFAASLGVKTLKELRDVIAKDMAREYSDASRLSVKEEVLDQLEKLLDFDVPETLAEQEFNHIWPRVREAKAKGGLDQSENSKTEKELEEDYRKVSARRVKLGLFLAELGKSANISVTNPELEQAIFAEASRFPGQERLVFDHYRKNPGMIEALRGPIFENKVIDHILGKADVTERKVSVEQLYQPSARAGKPEKPGKAEKGDPKPAPKPKATKKAAKK